MDIHQNRDSYPGKEAKEKAKNRGLAPWKYVTEDSDQQPSVTAAVSAGYWLEAYGATTRYFHFAPLSGLAFWRLKTAFLKIEMFESLCYIFEKR